MRENNFVGYEYQSVKVKRPMVPVYADGYVNFGWELEGTEEESANRLTGKLTTGVVTMNFKRDRKIRNKVELTRLQRNFDACANEILSMESSKRVMASVVGCTVGIIGTAFMTCSVFAVTAGSTGFCILLAIPAFLCWILSYFLFKWVENKKTATVSVLIEKKYDELYAVCEKAHTLLD